MKHLLEMNHFLPTLKTGNAKKSNVQFDICEIPENIKEFFSRSRRNVRMISNIHDDYSVDVNGDIIIYVDDLIDEKLPFKFGYVSGNFDCSEIDLKSLEGCLQKVGGDFNCWDNKLTSLEECLQKVGGRFDCSENELVSLKGCPKEVGGDFNCDSNQLTSLEGCLQKVGGYFSCYGNQLTSLKGCPQEVGRDFDCYNNQLTSLEGCPKEVGKDFCCGENPVKFTIDDVRQLCNVKGRIKV